jgi:hypothetical protein
MCAIISWGTHESFMHPIFVLKNRCDTMELLCDVGHVDSCFGPFGDSVSIGAR